MESRIDHLLKKYWAGETSLDEEVEIKMHMKENPSLDATNTFFRQLSKNKSMTNERSISFQRKDTSKAWKWIAASIVALLTSVFVFYDSTEQKTYVVDDPQEAYEVTRQALLMISSGLNESNKYSAELNNINKAQEIIQEK